MNGFSRFLVALSFINLGGCQEQVCMSGLTQQYVLRDDSAVTLSRQALQQAGIDIKNMLPVPYSSDVTKLFARNVAQNNSGYVLWHESGVPSSWEYIVSIQQRGDKLYCKATKGD
ncbi:MAG: hypothetical protein WBK91_01385 [Alphaproteobacteria bacterium]